MIIDTCVILLLAETSIKYFILFNKWVYFVSFAAINIYSWFLIGYYIE